MPSNQQAKLPRYSSTCMLRVFGKKWRCLFLFDLDEDDTYQYRHVILDKSMISLIPKNRLMDECEWRALGIKQGPHWEHYLIHKPGKILRLFFLLILILILFSIRTICSYVPSIITISCWTCTINSTTNSLSFLQNHIIVYSHLF